ncbi:thiamine biosynthesis protein ThiS [Pseudogulbenkiania sp. NH8B]|uniref:Thiamine biosynthesis protein ThiS n=1 Tax=Pseudogulbenkiania ferrooxidans 2002 TaxID=279714 RepID=B9Z985_9NEIS|nr:MULTISPECIES: sulfur carrier protein ThiS [Pseudogulbenkiania]EEG06667.1 thiamine biosynthesis protein ThiS [Pseudogulbenkiania ferrooxidans 2002]BAK76439.1 thiamine biosynthesis protein ThiS [Pseudogulbenkiania sp. NH8B]
MPTVLVNGEPTELATPLTVRQLLERLELQGRRVAIERNGDILPRSRYDDTRLAEGDRFEIIIAVGGG